MKHDLDAINAAITLGDPVFLPHGTIVEVLNGGQWELLYYAERGRTERIDVFRAKPIPYAGDYDTWIYSAVVKHVVAIPYSAPPFSKWKRL